MAKSKIQWTEHSVNPVVGCNRVSKGCDHCYAMMMAARLEAMGQEKYKGLTKKTKHGIDWSGKISFDLAALEKEVKRKQPTMFFVPSMGDLFHKDVPFNFIDEVMDIVFQNQKHVFQVLTKRVERMNKYMGGGYRMISTPNLWLGASVEDQKTADERIPLLLQTPSQVKWLSCEPLLDKISLIKTERAITTNYLLGYKAEPDHDFIEADNWGNINWVVVGCESGIRKRECKIEWIESIVEQCKEANVPVFVKQININGEVIKDIEQFPKHLLRFMIVP